MATGSLELGGAFSAQPRGRISGVLLFALLSAGCAKAPPPRPQPVAEPTPPVIELIIFAEGPPELAAPRPLAPRLRWTPAAPPEGTLVVMTVEPARGGLPIFEARARAGDKPIPLAPLRGGGFLGLVAAPISADEVSVEVGAVLIDGSRFTQTLALRVASRDFPATRLRVARRFTTPDERTLERIRRERQLIRLALGTVTETPLWRGPFRRPLDGRTTSPYGQRRLFNNELRSRHTGHDIDGETGDPVYAANSGRVALSRDLFFNGQAVFIDHGLGFYTGYFHLSERVVGEGQWVEQGELIGRVGATGRVTGPHLHWAAYLQGVHLDPLSLLDPGLAGASERLLGPTPSLAAAR